MRYDLREDSAKKLVNNAAAAALALTVLAATACQRDATRAASSGIAPTKPLSSLAEADRSRLCDWEAAWAGGYGKVHRCSAESGVGWSESRSECENSLRDEYGSCGATVAEYERCRRDVWSDPCAPGLLDRPTCAALNPCLRSALEAGVRRSKALRAVKP
jgi:hypothetical protein